MARPRRAVRALGAALVVTFTSLAAHACDVWTSGDGASILELRAFYKTLGSGLRMQPGLVEGTRALEAVVGDARAQLPPDQAALLPAAPALPPFGGLSAHTGRIWGRLLLGEHFEVHAGWQMVAVVASDPAFTAGVGLGGGVPVTGAQAARRRLVDFDPVLARSQGFLLQHNLDLLAVKARTRLGDLTVGRQVLSWGSGRLWSPTDLLSPFAPADIDREVRRGVDAVRLSVPLAETAQLELLWLPQPDARDHGGVARLQLNVRGFDLAPSAAKYVRDAVFGVDVAGDLGPLGVHTELAWTLGLDRDAGGRRDRFLRAVAGLDWRPLEKLILTGEYYFNGWGAGSPSAYLEVLRSPRVTRGEVFGAGRHYLGLVARWQASELLSIQGLTLTNLSDPSMLFVPALDYWAEQNVLVRVGGYLPLGRGPDPGPVQALTPDDLLQQTEAWRTATASLGLRSEYGVSPLGAFVLVGLYTP